MMASLELVFTERGSAERDGVTHFSDPQSPTRQFCDAYIERLYESRFVVRYRLPPRKEIP
jgi:hypothetical protein